MKEKKIGSYRLLDQLGAGGMGEVYSAYDDRLDREVAIKVIRPDLASKASAIGRFRREAKVLARVHHPYVVQVFEVIEEEDSLYLVMERLHGTTLRQTIDERGPLSWQQILTYSQELTEGVEAIHAAGLIHRDLKAENVMVTSHGHLKILDFGLAKPLRPLAGESTVSTEGRVAGTYAAMSPEQVQGQPLGPRSDLFSLGLLLYELASGEHPLKADSAESTLVRICRDLQPPLEERRHDAPVEFCRLVDRLLAKVPDQRPKSAGQALQVLEAVDLRKTASTTSPRPQLEASTLGSSEALPVTVARDGPKPERKIPLRLLAVTSVLLLAWFGIENSSRPDTLTLAVLELTDSVGENPSTLDWYGTTVPRFLASQLGESELRILDPDWVFQTQRQLGLKAGEIDERLWRALGADAVVTGSFLAASPVHDNVSSQAEIELRLLLRESPAPTWTYSGEISAETLRPLLADRSHEIRRSLRVSTASPGAAQALVSSWPTGGQAVELYGKGLHHLSRLESKEAELALESAKELDPDAARIRSALAEAYRFQGRQTKALEASRQALAMTDPRSEIEYLAAEARVREDEGAWKEAAALRRDILRLRPEDLNAGWRLAYTLTKGDRPQEALEVLEAVRRLPGAAIDPRLPLLAARAHYDSGDLGSGLAEAERAEALSRDLAAPGFLGQAFLLELFYAVHQQQAEDIERLFAAAEEQHELMDDRAHLAHLTEFLAYSLWQRKTPREAELWYRIALEEFEELDYAAGANRVRRALGAVLAELGRLQESSAIFSNRPTTTELQQSVALANEAANAMVAGDLAGAEAVFTTQLEVFRELGYPKYEAHMLANLGEIEYLRAHPERALGFHQDAGELYRWVGVPSDYSDLWLARIAAAQGRFDDAIDGLTELVTKNDSEAKVRLAELELELGRAAVARIRLEPLLQPGQITSPFLVPVVKDLFSRCELALGRPDSAAAVHASAVESALGIESFEIELRLRITAARLRASTLDQRRAELQNLAERAEAADFRGLAFEARLAEAELELEYEGSREGLERLRAQAIDEGLAGLTQRAEALLEPAG